MTRSMLLQHCARYPGLTIQDVLKFLHQSVFGPGHLVDSAGGGLDALRSEAASSGADIEPLDGPYVRAHLGLLNGGLAPETLWKLFVLSANAPTGTVEELEKRLSVLSALAKEGHLPFSQEEADAAIDRWRSEGFPLRRHSDAFRAAYAPAYRVIRAEYAPLLPLLTAIDGKLAEGTPLILAIEGGAASGKTTLAETLRKIYGCNVFHMDDFFLRPEQRTAQRLSAPGENVDHERFLEEVLTPLQEGRSVTFRRYDCHTQSLCPAVTVPPAPLTVVEGSYCCHDSLYDAYGLRCFLRISPDLQRRRIEGRNTPEFQQRFFDTWIPMEQRYHQAFSIPERCDIILEVPT